MSLRCFLNAVRNLRVINVSVKHVAFLVGMLHVLKDLHEATTDAYRLWKHSGKPRQGVVYNIMKQARSQFKYALRVCKSNTNSIISDKIAESICAKNDRAF